MPTLFELSQNNKQTNTIINNAVIINGHGSKTNQFFDIHHHVLLTPGDLTQPYILSVNAEFNMESAFKQNKLKNVRNGEWTFYDESISPKVPQVKIDPWKANETKQFANRVINDDNLWSKWDNQKGNYLDRDQNAILVVKKGNQYHYLDNEQSKIAFENINNQTYDYNKQGTPLFFYAPLVGKVKILSSTSLSEVLENVYQIDGDKLVMLATCNAGKNNTTISYDQYSADIKVTDLAKQQWAERNDFSDLYDDLNDTANHHHYIYRNEVPINNEHSQLETTFTQSVLE